MKTGLLGAALLVWTGGAMTPQQGGTSESEFRHTVTSDPETKWAVYTLSYRQERHSAAARIVPEGGNNLVSLEVDGVQVLHEPPKIADSRGVHYGVPLLYPTPNRVRDAHFTFEGRTFQFEPNNGKNFIHGLVHGAAWRAETPVASRDGVRLRTHLDFDESFPGFARFPIRNRISVTYTLASDGIVIGYEVENRDTRRLPFGFALHPYFKILGERAQTFLRVPAESHMQAEELLPTGRLEPLEGSRHDLRAFASLGGLNLDDVYFGMKPGGPAGYEARDTKVGVTLEASDVFTHAVVYTPPGRPFFCIENQTCSTDAHNLHARGLVREAHLQIVEPGKRAAGTVRIRVRRL